MDDQAPSLASLVAWGTLSALLPLLLGVLSVAGLILRDQQRLDALYGTLIALVPSGAAGPLADVLNSMRQPSAAPAGIVAILLLLVNGSSFFSNLASVFDKAYHVQERNIVLERAIALAMLVVTAALLVLSTTAAGVSGIVKNLPGTLPIGPELGQVVGWSISIVSVFLLALFIYRFLPNAKQSWREVIPGTLLAAALLLVVSQLFPIYLSLFPPNHAYAVFGVFLVFTFWLYLVGLVLVLGAELNAFLIEPSRSLALAEATRAAEMGQAEYQQSPNRLTAETSGRAPVMEGVQGDVPGTRPSPTHGPVPPSSRGHTSLAGRLVGLVGLVLAALLLRNRSATRTDERATA